MTSLLFFALLLQNPRGKTPTKASDSSAATAAAPATVRGKVSAADTGAPLKHAVVTMRIAGMSQESYTASTNNDGTFEILNIPIDATPPPVPKAYFVMVSRSGYVNSSYMKGKDQGMIQLSSGTEVKDVDILMQRAGIIAGVVLDEHDEAIPGVQVQVMMKMYQQGQMRLQQVNSKTTDDRGNYRVYDLTPGRYYLQAVTHTNSQQTVPHYAPALYPSATRMADAQAVKIGPGEEVSGMKIVMHEAPVFNVAGRVVDGRTSQPAGGANINVNPEDWSAGGSNANNRSKPDGSFVLSELTPGRYRVNVNMPDPAQRGKALNSMRSLEVTDHDIKDWVVSFGDVAKIKGHLVAEGGDLPDKLRVMLMARGNSGGYISSTQPVMSDAAGNFEIPDVAPATYEVNVTPVNQQTMTTQGKPNFFFTGTIMVGNQDVTDTGLTVAEGASVVETTVTLDYRYGAVTGQATDANGQPLGSGTVILVSADPKKREWGRYFRQTRSDATGKFQASTLIPGDYMIMVWPINDPSMVLDPDVFSLIQKYFVPITVKAQATATQDVRLSSEVQPIVQVFSQQP